MEEEAAEAEAEAAEKRALQWFFHHKYLQSIVPVCQNHKYFDQARLILSVKSHKDCQPDYKYKEILLCQDITNVSIHS